MPFARSRTLATLAVLTLLVALSPAPAARAQAQTQTTPGASRETGGASYALPGDDVFPKGVAYDPAADAFYAGSTEDGTLYRGDRQTGAVTVFSEPGADGRTAVNGLKVDAAGRLYVAGRGTGRVFVYDTASGDLIAQFANDGAGDTLVNDIALAPDGSAYVTDSTLPVLYRVPPPEAFVTGAATPAGGAAELSVVLEFSDSVFPSTDGLNATGIVVTPDGAFLLVISFDAGRLYRVDLATEEVREVDLGGATLASGNGLALAGQTLYVVLTEDAAIAPVTLALDFASGSVGETITDPSFDYPTTIDLVDERTALVANHQLADGSPPTLPFTISEIALPAPVPAAATPAS